MREGKALSVETREKISKARKEYFARNPDARKRIGEQKKSEALERFAQIEYAAITHKKCTKCEETKPVADFPIRRESRKCGVIYVRPEAACRKCCADRARRNEERRRAEGGVDSTERARRWRAKLTPEKKEEQRRKDRERATIRRREEGIKPRNFSKPRTPQTHLVPIEPASVLLEVLIEEGLTKAEIAARSGVNERRLYEIHKCAVPHTELDNVDKLLIAFDRQDDLNELYPPEEPEPLIGYGVIDPEGVLKTPGKRV